MRQLTQLKVDPMWVVCNKELVSVAVVGPWLVWRMWHRQPIFPSYRMLALLVAVGISVQLGANLLLQWSLGVVGMAVAIPAIFGVMLTTSAAMGQCFLGERVSRRSMAAIGLLLIALATLGIATYAGRGSNASATSEVLGSWTLLLGIAAPCFAGAIYAVLSITISHAGNHETPIPTIVFFVTVMAVVMLGPMSFLRAGSFEILWDTSAVQYAWMLAAGTLNLIAFLAISKGLKLTTVVHVNMLNASQVAMASAAGIFFFDEAWTNWMTLGVVLTIVGIVLIGQPDDEEHEADQHI